MLNINELENRWLRYKIKSYIPHITIIISSIIIITLFLVLNTSKNEDKPLSSTIEIKEKVEVITEKPKAIPVEKEILQNTDTQTYSQSTPTLQANTIDQKEPLKLSPSLDFMKKMQHSTLPYYQSETKVSHQPKTEKPIEKIQKITKSDIVEEIQHIEVQESIEPVKKEVNTINISRRDVADDIRHVIKRFKKSNNPALSLFVAKKYYELEDYHKAYNYALITNKIDNQIDASWIIFAKSLVKLNQKEMAIETLKQYTQESHSSSAKILLDEIVSGKFK